MHPLKLQPGQARFRLMAGTGGIGSGLFFRLNGDHTLGREESRSGRFVNRDDYCKLHIISHYVQTLMGEQLRVVPFGRVGDDAPGRKLHAEMAATGMDMSRVEIAVGEQTLFCICLIYPDGGGGNLTVDDSACARVDAACIMAGEPVLAGAAGQGLALAVPEVPLAARRALLELATRHGLFRAASFTSGEIPEALAGNLLRQVDLLAVNLDEAAALAGVPAASDPAKIAAAAAATACTFQPDMLVSVTAGKHGSYLWAGGRLDRQPVLPVKVASTAGAGDAHFSGLITGLAAGLQPGAAHELAALVAALSVTSPHTINKEIGRDTLRFLAASLPTPPCPAVRALLEE